MVATMPNATPTSGADHVKFSGRILFLYEKPELVRAQLEGRDVGWLPDEKLIDNISTDEITPAWVCFYYDETLGQYVNVGLRGGIVKKDEIKNGGFEVIVSGLSKGCGSSRETAPYAEKHAGIRLVIARSIEKIYGQNSENIGLLTSTDFGLIPRILAGEGIALDEFTRGRNAISREIVTYGGLPAYSRARLAGQAQSPAVATAARPMNLVEKILARAAIRDARTGETGIPFVKPGDAFFVRADVRFTHEYVTPMAEAIFKQSFGSDARVRDPQDVYAFRDHLTFLGQVMPKEQKDMGLLERADGLAVTQRSFTDRQGIRLYGEVPEGGSEAICHNAVLEDIGFPGQVVVGTDSHTCTAGALGCFAFGVGATDMANAWFTGDARVEVPEVVRFVVSGRRASDVVAKDVMLFIMSTDFFRSGKAIGKVLEFTGPGVTAFELDERAVLTNMAVEAGAFTGIIEPDDEVVRYICAMRGLDPAAVRARILRADPDAQYAHSFDIRLDDLRPMVATPGDPRNGIPIDTLKKDVVIQIAYGGSCTGGKMADMDQYASVLKVAVERGLRVADGVDLYLQFGSQKIRQYAERKGYIDIFQKAGAKLVNPSCGACIKAGPGVSLTKDQVTVSAINRNFPGRSGPGQVYLASPLVVAASAVAGRIVEPSWLLGDAWMADAAPPATARTLPQ
jgi:3-isopropylmalate/(R)-2-methylmalate dehydratase large subunit